MSATLGPFTIVRDTREQAPLAFPDWTIKSGTLAAGDYSVVGLEEHIAVERKELSDFLGCVTHDRDRFKRELQRLRAYRYRAVVIEATLQGITGQHYRSRVAPAAVIGSMTSWVARFEVPFFLVGDRAGAEAVTLAFLRNAFAQIGELVAAIAGPAGQQRPDAEVS